MAPGGAVSAENVFSRGYEASPWFGERIREIRLDDGVRAIVVAPGAIDETRPTRRIVYATPNGNTAEQTLGCAPAEDRDWHFDIQHVAAQVRRFREMDGRENVVLICVQPEPLSWPAWRRDREDADARIRRMIETLAAPSSPGEEVRVTLAAHSGGGSFLFGYLNAVDRIPGVVDRIVFLDADYAYSNEARHGDKLIAWLRSDADHRLVVLAYDDRDITLRGKKVVGPRGGTYRATHRMLARLGKDLPIERDTLGEFIRYATPDRRVVILVHPNPRNRILHTRLVGEMNGLLYALGVGFPGEGTRGTLGGPRAYSRWIQPAPFSFGKE